MTQTSKFLATAFGVFISVVIALSSAHAQLIEAHATNIQLLRGWAYELGPQERTIITIEHGNRWRYGDFYAFADITVPDDGDVKAYAEISPRLSFEKVTGNEINAGPISDIFIAANYEKGDHNIRRYLLGMGVNLKAPGFTYLKANAYWRQDPLRPGKTYQTTIIWKRVFDLGPTTFTSEGFMDIAGGEGDFVANQLFVPRFLIDIGAFFNAPGKVFGGAEWQYWRNKFGVENVNESALQLQLKYAI